MLVFLVFAAAAVCAGVEAWLTRSLATLALALIGLGLAVMAWPG